MKSTLVAEGIHLLSINVKDILFEEMWEIPNGVTLNSYIVSGQKTAIIDGVCGWDGIPENLYDLLGQIEVNPQDIDYLIINHMEPDHSGWIEDFRKIKKDFTIYCSAMAAKLLDEFYEHNDNIHVIKNNEQLDLGDGKVLKFITTPNVHWPDTMMTIEQSTKTVFSCDMFGSFGVMEQHHFDDQMTEAERKLFADEEIRYYSNVLNTYNKFVLKAIDAVEAEQPVIIAPGHGPIYRQSVQSIIKRYRQIAGFNQGQALPEVTVLWGSMYGMTEVGVKRVLAVLEDNNIKANVLHVPYVKMGEVLSKVVRAAGIIVAAPTYENNMYPNMAAIIDELGRKAVTNKKALHIGSYGWSGGSAKEMAELNQRNNMGWEFIEPVVFKGRPTKQDLTNIEQAVKQLIDKIKE